jgi:hypothetical protein
MVKEIQRQVKNITIDAHRVKIPGTGYLMFLPKFLAGSRLSGKIAWGGGSPYFGFYCIFINKFLKICLGGAFSSPSPLPLCASMNKNDLI